MTGITLHNIGETKLIFGLLFNNSEAPGCGHMYLHFKKQIGGGQTVLLNFVICCLLKIYENCNLYLEK